jgi:tetratricopeptide (TPR) repeat protein
MRPEDWQRASALFERALDVEPANRAAWLLDQCAGDADLRKAVERLLRADESAEDFLERPFSGKTEPLGDRDTDHVDGAGDIAGTMFGSYRALRSIGAGGMGEVWLASRADGEFEQQVAIKRLLYPTPELVRRFRQERRVLAGLRHPNIAQLHDGGVGTDGAPYFVMEYVEGEPITVWSDTHRCDLAARIGLMLQVCDAVQFAHRNLVVHRDLKPSNVLVDAGGQVKLLDFGIAKVLEDTDGRDDATATLVQRLTPDYAAPEQLRGDVVTTATDVYALGVVLFELLAGDRPNRGNRQRGDAERASVNTSPAIASAVAARSEGLPRGWATRLRGDVDRIIAKAMAKEPERRYASAEALADDLRRHVQGRPVLARGDDAMYRLRKFIGRNRAGVSAAAAAILALVAATAVSVYQARVARTQAERADAERVFVLGILDANDPNETQGRQLTLTAREILDRAAARIDKDLADQPTVRAELYDEIGNLYWDYGLYSTAQPLFERAVALSATADVPAMQRAAFMIDLGQNHQAQRQLADSEKVFREAFAFARAELGEDSDEAFNARAYLSETLAFAGRFAESEMLARESLATASRLYPKTGADYAIALDRVAFVTMESHHFPEAVALGREEVAIYERVNAGVINSRVGTSLNQLGLALIGDSRIAEAEAALRRALGIHEQLLGKNHPHYAGTQSNLGHAVDMAGHFDEAKMLLDTSLAARTRLFGADSFVLASTSRNRALNALHRGALGDAESDARMAFTTDTRTYGSENQATVESATVLADVLVSAQKIDEAQSLLGPTIVTAERLFGKTSDVTAYLRALHARALAASGHVAEAIPLFATSIDALHASMGDRHFETTDALCWLGEAERANGDLQRADATSARAVASAREAYPAGDALIADSLALRGRVLVALGRAADAEPPLREALALRRSALRADDARVVEVAELLHAQPVTAATASAANGAATH